jgi:hypothetical protein
MRNLLFVLVEASPWNVDAADFTPAHIEQCAPLAQLVYGDLLPTGPSATAVVVGVFASARYQRRERDKSYEARLVPFVSRCARASMTSNLR